MAQATVVSNTSGTVGRFSHRNTTVATSTQTTEIRHLSSVSSNVQTTRLEVVEQSHRNRGFSDAVATRMAKAQKQSSLQVYEGKWQIYCHWCQERSIDPLQAPVNVIASFLTYLHEEKELVVSTIEGYRTAISNTLKAVRGEDIGKDPDLSSLMANFVRDNTKIRPSLPCWNLSLVLRMLTKSPFEPMHRADLKHVTLKTVFLVALATGKRRSELHALRKDILHSKHWSSITILPDPQFVAKTQLNSRGGEVLNSVTIKALTKILGDDMQDDRSLCAVRAVRYYLKATKDIRKNRQKLFIAYRKGYPDTQEIHLNTVSGWLKKTILLAYDTASEEDTQVTGVKAHQVRAMAASWALHSRASLEDIMQACSWKSANTFTSFYLKDMALQRDEMFHLGPVVAASHTAGP